MPKETPTPSSSLIPPPLSEGTTHRSYDRVHPNEATVATAFESMDNPFDRMAASLYSLASMLVGEGDETMGLVETAVSTAEVAAGSRPEDAPGIHRLALSTAAVELIADRDPESLAAPDDLQHAVICIEDDDLDAASEARDALERMIAGPDRDRVRTWLESLPTAMRTIYVLRAVTGLTAPETANVLALHGGPLAAEWTPEAVRELFRQALCSLASQLIHATAGR
jgi:hypothetical protein